MGKATMPAENMTSVFTTDLFSLAANLRCDTKRLSQAGGDGGYLVHAPCSSHRSFTLDALDIREYREKLPCALSARADGKHNAEGEIAVNRR